MVRLYTITATYTGRGSFKHTDYCHTYRNTRSNTWVSLYQLFLIKSCRISPYLPSRVHCSWHLDDPMNNWSDTSRLDCSLTWYICPAHQTADAPTRRLGNRLQLRRLDADGLWWMRIISTHQRTSSERSLPQSVRAGAIICLTEAHLRLNSSQLDFEVLQAALCWFIGKLQFWAESIKNDIFISENNICNKIFSQRPRQTGKLAVFCRLRPRTVFISSNSLPGHSVQTGVGCRHCSKLLVCIVLSFLKLFFIPAACMTTMTSRPMQSFYHHYC